MAALPKGGMRMMEQWLASTDPDVRRIMKENLSKKRLGQMDSGWVARWRTKFAAGLTVGQRVG